VGANKSQHFARTIHDFCGLERFIHDSVANWRVNGHRGTSWIIRSGAALVSDIDLCRSDSKFLATIDFERFDLRLVWNLATSDFNHHG
jgi:hypothetical protein